MQPPSGGCVLKRFKNNELQNGKPAATFGWLCVETQEISSIDIAIAQPPSGGCVLKHQLRKKIIPALWAATFGWLCVETIHYQWRRAV